jgi:DNA-binding beta-propeller fold protein YncE
MSRGAEQATVATAEFSAFNSLRDALEWNGARISGPNSQSADGRATVAQDVEPEYIAVAPDGRTAWVSLQENNALAEIDIQAAVVTRIIGLGLKDHTRPGNGLDASDRDDGIQIRRWPLWGMYQPDSIAAFDAGGRTFIVTANEGDGREYGDYSDESRVADLRLDKTLLVRDPELQNESRLGRLKVSRVGGDLDGDGDIDRLLAFGGRSIAIWNDGGELVYDSGDALERFVAEHLPERFNIDEDGSGTVDDRSPAKGPEPEGIAVGRVGRSIYAFVGLERTSAIAIFDVTCPAAARLVDVVTLDFDRDAAAGRNIAPEGLAFIPPERNPLGEPLLAVACEVTGTTILFRVQSIR